MPPAIKMQPVSVDRGTIEILEGQAARRLEDPRERDDAWIESGVEFTRENGVALDLETGTRHFRHAVNRSMLPPIRPHDLRLTHATLALQAEEEALIAGLVFSLAPEATSRRSRRRECLAVAHKLTP